MSEEGRKDDAGKIGFEFLPADALGEINEIMRFGAKKYSARNWERGMAWTRPANAALRHIFAWMAGERKDTETGRSHLAHAGCCILFLLSYEKRQIGKDDRAPSLSDLSLAEASTVKVRGPCAKQVVTATLLTLDGGRFVGTNECANAQAVCPRETQGMKTGEGYYLCKEICEQGGHAEQVAINKALADGASTIGARIYLEGHTYACGACLRQARNAEAEIVIGAPPTYGEIK